MVEPLKFHLYEPAPVLLHAYQKALKTGRSTYVNLANNRFNYSKNQPCKLFSHWRVDPDGSIYAHFGVADATEYVYEKADWKLSPKDLGMIGQTGNRPGGMATDSYKSQNLS